MTQVSPVTINNSTINVSNITNDQGGSSATTHDISHLIPNNANKEFILSPTAIHDSLIVTLDGLVLKPSFNNNAGDYTLTNGNVLTLDSAIHLESDSVLLAIYRES